MNLHNWFNEWFSENTICILPNGLLWAGMSLATSSYCLISL
jgi:hypothetical protein